MRRAFVESTLLTSLQSGDILVLPKEVSHHLLRVLRLRIGEEIEVFDGDGHVALGQLLEGIPARLQVSETRAAMRELPPLVVAQAAVRQSKVDEVLRRGTELGASALWIFQAERSVVDATLKKADRMVRIAREAARQSERCDVPELDGPMSFDELCGRVRDYPGVCAFGALEATMPYSEVLRGDSRFVADGSLFIVGPEGGLSEAEQRALTDAGAVGVRVGPHVQRTETAGLSALSAALCALGGL